MGRSRPGPEAARKAMSRENKAQSQSTSRLYLEPKLSPDLDCERPFDAITGPPQNQRSFPAEEVVRQAGAWTTPHVEETQHMLRASEQQTVLPSHSNQTTSVQSATLPKESPGGMAGFAVEIPMHESRLKLHSGINATQNFSVSVDLNGENYSPQMMRYLAEGPLDQPRLIGYVGPAPSARGEEWSSTEVLRRH